MASQTGILGLQGTVGGLVFAKDGSVRQKPASNKAAFASSASLARTRENAAEFGLSAKYSKLLRDSLRVAIASASDSRVALAPDARRCAPSSASTTRTTGASACSTRRTRPRCSASTSTPGAGIGQTMYFPYEVTGAGADVTMSIPALNPASDIAAPQGATHFEVVFAASDLDMETLTYTNGVVAAPLGILPLNGAPLVNQTVVASFPAAPAAANLVVGVVGINFYQQINGKFYPLNNNSTNPLAIEYVA